MYTTTKTISLDKKISNKKLKEVFWNGTGLLIFISNEKDEAKTECGYLTKEEINKASYEKHEKALNKKTKYLEATNR